jgi:hypothetical protein
MVVFSKLATPPGKPAATHASEAQLENPQQF